MVKHVVMWRFNSSNPDTFEKTRFEVKSLLEKLPGLIPDIDTLEVGINFNDSQAAYDMVLITTHADRIALKNYQVHPEHQLVAKRIGELAVERTVVDFE